MQNISLYFASNIHSVKGYMYTMVKNAHSTQPEIPLQLRHNEGGGVSNHQRLHCFLNCWFRRRSKKTSKLRVTGVCAGNSPVTGEFPAQKASNAENISIWLRHHVGRVDNVLAAILEFKVFIFNTG